VQLDLEPFSAAYAPTLLRLLNFTSQQLAGGTEGCVTSRHAEGRSLSVFAFAESVENSPILQVLGPSGYVSKRRE
jgi:hypothetical protein